MYSSSSFKECEIKTFVISGGRYFTPLHIIRLTSLLYLLYTVATKTSAGTPTHHGTGATTLSSKKVCYSEKGKGATASSMDWKQSDVDVKENEAYGSLPERYTSLAQQPAEYEEVHVYDPVTY